MHHIWFLHTFRPLPLLNKRDTKNNLKQARARAKVGAKSHTTQGQIPIHTSVPEYPIISGWLFFFFFQIDFRVFSGNFDIGLFQIWFMSRIGMWRVATENIQPEPKSKSVSVSQ